MTALVWVNFARWEAAFRPPIHLNGCEPPDLDQHYIKPFVNDEFPTDEIVYRRGSARNLHLNGSARRCGRLSNSTEQRLAGLVPLSERRPLGGEWAAGIRSSAGVHRVDEIRNRLCGSAAMRQLQSPTWKRSSLDQAPCCDADYQKSDHLQRRRNATIEGLRYRADRPCLID